MDCQAASHTLKTALLKQAVYLAADARSFPPDTFPLASSHKELIGATWCKKLEHLEQSLHQPTLTTHILGVILLRPPALCLSFGLGSTRNANYPLALVVICVILCHMMSQYVTHGTTWQGHAMSCQQAGVVMRSLPVELALALCASWSSRGPAWTDPP